MAQVVLKIDLSPEAMLLLTDVGLSSATADLTYLRLDATNGPLTGPLASQTITPNLNSNYSLGSTALHYLNVFADHANIIRLTGAGTTSGTSIGSFASAVGCTVNAGDATSTAKIVIGGAGAVHYCAGVAAYAVPAGSSSTVEMLGTSGTNFGSAVSVIADPNVVTLVRFTSLSSGSFNLGSALGEVGATNASIIISGDGVFNTGDVRGLGGTLTLSGDTTVNLGTLKGGTLTLSGDNSFNLGTVETGGTLTVGGIGSYNMAHVRDGVVNIAGNDCLNLGSIDDAGSTITLTGNNVQNLMSVTTTADITVNGGLSGVFLAGLATASTTVLASASGTNLQGYFLGRAVTNITASGTGAYLRGVVDVSVAGSTPGTVTMTSSGPGSVLFGSISAAAAGTGASTILSSGTGSVVLGSIALDSTGAANLESTGTGTLAGGACLSGLMRASNLGALLWGYTKGSTSQMLSSGTGSVYLGVATATSTGTSIGTSSGTASTIIGGSTNTGTGPASQTASSTGSTIIGAAIAANSGTAIQQSTSFGSTIIGLASGGSTASATMTASNTGATVIGACIRASTTSSVMEALTAGATVIGTANAGTMSAGTGGVGLGAFVRGYVSSGGTMTVTGGGAEVSGRCLGVTMSATGLGARVSGYGVTNNMTAAGDGSGAYGSSANGAIVASFANSQQFGPGTNAEAESLKVGTAGIRFSGINGGPGTPVNGDFYIGGAGNAFVIVKSNAKLVQINLGQAYTHGAYTANVRAVPASALTALTDNSGGTANTTLQNVGVIYTQAEVANNFADCALAINTLNTQVTALTDVLNQLVQDFQTANHIN